MKFSDKDNKLQIDIFLELLRCYHNGVGAYHSEESIKEVAHNLAKKAYFMALEYERTIEAQQ